MLKLSLKLMCARQKLIPQREALGFAFFLFGSFSFEVKDGAVEVARFAPWPIFPRSKTAPKTPQVLFCRSVVNGPGNVHVTENGAFGFST